MSINHVNPYLEDEGSNPVICVSVRELKNLLWFEDVPWARIMHAYALKSICACPVTSVLDKCLVHLKSSVCAYPVILIALFAHGPGLEQCYSE